MGVPYAEVIGDPVAHSKSPLIHKFWLERLGLRGAFKARKVTVGGLGRYLADASADPFWRGCSVTAPLKVEAARQVGDPTGISARIGAANAIFRSAIGASLAANTDLHGFAAALDDPKTVGNRVCVIGAGGAARTALEFLRLRKTAEVSLVARDLARAKSAHGAFDHRGGIYPFERAAEAIAGAEWVINATPLGMAGMPPMPQSVLDGLAQTEKYAIVADMVYAPLDTALLARARALGRKAADGLTMLIGQAEPAFELFFGVPAPQETDLELRKVLTS